MKIRHPEKVNNSINPIKKKTYMDKEQNIKYTELF